MKLGSHTALNHPMGDSPPEPTKEDIRNDVIEHAERYNNAKEDLEGALADVEEFKQIMKDSKEYLWSEHGIEEEDIERISDDD
jgi:hypothetical protein